MLTAARVACGFMPIQDEAAGPAKDANPWMGVILLIQVTLITATAALTRGLSWKGLLHWTGELLLIIGIALAAVGISDVRREWTRLPGIRGRVQQAAQTIQARTASFMWTRWNRVVQWDWLAKPLHLRPHSKSARLPPGSASTTGACTALTSAYA